MGEIPRGYMPKEEKVSGEPQRPAVPENNRKPKGLLQRLSEKKKIAGLMLGLGVFGPTAGAIERRVGKEKPTITEVMPEAPELNNRAKEYFAFAGLEKWTAPQGTFDFKGEKLDRKQARQDLSVYVRDSMRSELLPGSSIPDSCADALQCFLYYEGQANFSGNKDFMEALTQTEALTQDELTFLKSVIQIGYLLPAPRYEGAVTMRDEGARAYFPLENVPASENKRKAKEYFDEELYKRHLAFLLEHARQFRLTELTPSKRGEVMGQLADIIRTRNELDMQDLAVWQTHKDPKTYRITKRTEQAEGSLRAQHASMEQLTQQFDALFNWYKNHSEVFKKLPSEKQRALHQITQDLLARHEHKKVSDTLRNLVRQAQKEWSTSWQVEELEPIIEQETSAIAEIDRQLQALLSQGPVVAAK